jgi:enolase
MSDSQKIANEYLQKYQVTKIVEEALNELTQTCPEDAYGALSRILKKKALPPTIHHVVGREVLDSRGNPTVEVDVYANHLGEIKFVGRSSAPSGASTGSGEARELRDKDSPRYGGKGTLTAAKNASTLISEAIAGMKFDSLRDIDMKICQADGTELKDKIGGNACTAASFACAEAAAELRGEQLFEYFAKQFGEKQKFKLPSPFFNIINGGKHAGGNLQIQEFMVCPTRSVPFPDQLRMVAEVYQKLGSLLAKEFGPSAKNLGDEGGFAPLLETPEQALSIIERACTECGYKPGVDILFGLDAAASEFYRHDQKKYEVEIGVFKTGDEMVEYWADLVAKHPAIVSIEDGLDELDHETWIKLTAKLGSKIQIVGDDLYTTNPKTITKGVAGKWANALLLKVNQIGTISEAMDAAKLIFDAGQNVMVSHRSGETCNSVISDLAVGIGAQYIKTGSTARGERIQKYTRLLQIYEYLKERDMHDES